MNLKTIIKEIKAKSIIVKSKLPDADYVINPYIGCQHSCIYCYSEFMKRFTNHHEKWGTFIDVKISAPQLIKANGQYHNKNIFLSSTTDPYQPLEAKYKLTRQILEKLVPEQPIIEILTKSRLVTRDTDLFKKFDNITIGISLSTLNEKYSQELEPYASLPKLRLEALKQCKAAGLRTYVFISPIFPYITELEKIIELSNPYVDYFMFENLNLRSTNKSKVYDFIKKNNPNLLDKYKEIYEGKNHKYWQELEIKIKDICKKYNKEARIYFHHGSPRAL